MVMVANGLGKLMEECGEVVQICAKKLACPDSDEHWDGKGSLKVRLEDEIADVMAASMLVMATHDLDATRIAERADAKLKLFTQWQKQTNDAPKPKRKRKKL